MCLEQHVPGQFIDVNGVRLHYEMIGSGAKVILFLCGACGTTRTDFDMQLENLDRKKFTLVSFDPPGHGYSRPPEKVYNKTMIWDEARLARDLMQKLGFDKFVVAGWCQGGRAALSMAIMFPNCVEKLILWGAAVFIDRASFETLLTLKDVDQWTDAMRAPYLKVYGLETFRDMWRINLEQTARMLDPEKGGDHCSDRLCEITCSTLILHGDKDPFCSQENVQCLQKNIVNNRLVRFPKGGHCIHHEFAESFNRILEDFLA